MEPGRPHRLRLRPQTRLKQSRDFAKVRAEGQRLVWGCLIANWISLPEGKPSRLGVVTGSKIGPAVVRSRARRLLREAYRLHQYELLAPVDLILVARRSIAGKMLADVEKDFLTTLKKAGLFKSGSTATV